MFLGDDTDASKVGDEEEPTSQASQKDETPAAVTPVGTSTPAQEQPQEEQSVTPEQEAQEGAPEAPVAEEEVLAALSQAEQPQPEMQAQEDGMMALHDEIASLRESIEGIKSLLEKVSIREPISEDDADKAEKSVGMKSKPGKAVEAQPNMADMLARKLGGF